MTRLTTILAAIGLSLASAPAAQASMIGSLPQPDWLPSNQPAALNLPADLGAGRGDGAIMQLTFQICMGQAACTNRAWANPFVNACRAAASDEQACFGPMGAVRVALHGLQASAAQQVSCPNGLVPATGANGAQFCVPPGTVVD